MKNPTKALLAAAMLTCCAIGNAQNYYDPRYEPNYAYEFNPGTGDAVLDALLRSLNTYYAGDVNSYNSYVDDIVYSTGAPRAYVQTMVVERHYPPADVYLMAQTAAITGQPITTVQREFDANRGQGWGVVAKRLGIKPGSPEFHRLKSGADSWSTRAKVKKVKVKHKDGNSRSTVVTQTRTSNVIVHEQAKAGHPGKGHGSGKSKGKGKDKKNK